MKVILLKDVRAVGKKFDIKTVSDGYALNYLIPNHLAEVAQGANLKKVEQMKVQESLKQKQHEDTLRLNLKKVEGQSVSYEAKVNEKGHLFKGVHKEEIAALLKDKAGVELSPEYITLEKPIKEIGSHVIPLSIGDSMVNFTLDITAQK
jgi:large subunit ribosomal protein L9